MPDISMCRGDNCPIKKSCYRFTAYPDLYSQSFLMDVPYRHESNKCEMYWPNKKEQEDKLCDATMTP